MQRVRTTRGDRPFVPNALGKTAMTYLPSPRLDGRVAVVTGASSGLGRHIALSLAELGADIALVARRAEALEVVADEVSAMGRTAMPIPADVTRIGLCGALVQRVVAELGQVDILVNNAGTNIQQDAFDVTEDAWDTVLGLNLKAAFFFAQAAAQQMRAQGTGGRIINIASQMAEVGFYKRAAYCASKGALVQLTKVLAIEWAQYGIRVNAVGPTFIDSPMARQMFEDESIRDEVTRRLPIGRLGRMAEVSAAVAYLASDGADLVTGHHLLVDGGWTAW